MRSAAAATALGITLTLAGLASCAGPDDPVQPPGPDPTRTPVFASDEEALAAAEEVYGEYNRISNELGQHGWLDTSHLQQVLTADALSAELETSSSFASKGFTQVGASTFDSVSLQQLVDRGHGSVSITVYVCLDVSSVDVLDADGHSVVTETRPDRQPLEVQMSDSSGELKIERNEAWSGANFC